VLASRSAQGKKGLVAEIRRVVEVKDASQECVWRGKKRRDRTGVKTQKKADTAEKRRSALTSIRDELFALFSEVDAHKRGKTLEGVLNRLFDAFWDARA